MKQQQHDDLVPRKKRKLPKLEDDGTTASGDEESHGEDDEQSEIASATHHLEEDNDKKPTDKADDAVAADKKELPKKDTAATAPVIPMTAMMFPMTMMMPMMLPFPQGSGVGLVDEIPKKKKRGRPSKKSLAQQSTPSINSADQPLSMPMWPFGMPLMPMGFKFPMNPIMVAPQVKNGKDHDGSATASVMKAGSVEDHSSTANVSREVLADDLKKKVRSTSGKPRGRPRTRPRPGDVISRPKLMNLAPAVLYDHINGGGPLDKDPKEEEEDEDDDPNKGGGSQALLPGERVV
ncbi:hypothetical protein DYB28_011036 [Aphanomyces astaci]|uniref:Uncharacterized protein n=1 Tax=Aphanomyces astaci TaxID=112090 RepID=A0A9X8E717_APHAT|nr:hypothetical protein DYB28_011036 [Aphanomyces astaci]